MQQDSAFRINGPDVIHETIDGEVVLINLKVGTYYSTDEVGAALWALVESGLTAGEIAAAIRARYDGDAAAIDRGVADFLAELVRESLVVPAPAGARNGAAAGAPAEGLPFSAPVLHKYTDMKDMLLLDPIHDVEETGWPAPKAGS